MLEETADMTLKQLPVSTREEKQFHFHSFVFWYIHTLVVHPNCIAYLNTKPLVEVVNISCFHLS